MDDVAEFTSDDTRNFYTKHGLPYIRTYLFYGNPGNGKTSCIKSLASELNMNLYSLNLSSAQLDDSALVDMIHSVRRKSIVAIEDVDRVFNNHTGNESPSSVSFSTMLNVMDGILSKDSIIFVLTCNNKDLLDDALRRCGRIHREFEFPDASAKVAEDMFLSFYPEQTESAKVFAKKIRDKQKLPVASLQEFFVRNRKRSADEAASENLDAKNSMFVSRRKVAHQEMMST
jgi:chaperone BCS1